MPEVKSQQQAVVDPLVKKTNGNNLLGRTGRDKDFLYIAEGSRKFTGEKVNMGWNSKTSSLVARTDGKRPKAKYTSDVISCRFPATEFLPSWNIQLPQKDHSFKVFIRVGDESKLKFSPWMFMGEGGAWVQETAEKTEAKGWGTSKIDYLKLTKPASAFQFKVEFQTTPAASADESPMLRRFFVHYSGEAPRPQPALGSASTNRAFRVPVPYRSQLDVSQKALRHIICCPTCVAMVLEHHGINQPTLSVCESVYDQRHKIYGIWPKAAQAAAQYGCRAWVHRFRSMSNVRERLNTGMPIIASIRTEEGQLRGARYPRSNGHLIVITGYRGNSKVRVNDPYSAGSSGGEIEYETSDIEKVWLDNGGVAILIERENTKDD